MTASGQRCYVDCAVIIVTYNSALYIDGMLNSLSVGAGELTLRTIVVDNGSTDDTVRRVRDHRDVICVEAGANLGYAGGINVGRRHAGRYGALAVLNPDLVLEPGALYEMCAAVDDPGVGVAVPTLLDFDGRLYPSLRREPSLIAAIGDAVFGRHFKRRPVILSEIVRDERRYGERHPVDWAVGAALVVSAACDRRVGAWDERFFLYSEETDYAARARAAGFRVEYVPRAQARHRGAGSGRSQALIALKAVNRVRYFEKHRKTAGAMRAAVLLHELLRVASPGHRRALLTVWRRSSWEPLTSSLKTRSAKTAALR
jgi:N-acetylglucosaminyl-diphospho-decaprenol L-rhamnosyltransferase